MGGQLTTEQIERRVKELSPWFHNLDLNGVRTAPGHFLGDYPNIEWKSFADAIPKDLSGKSVLDLGCNAGFFSIQMKLRGAKRVVGVDMDERYLAQAKLATEVAGVDVELRQLNVYDVARLGEKFDLVLFMGVLYHLRHPLLALDLLAEHVVGDLLVFQSMQRGSQTVEEVAADYPFEEKEIFNRPGFPKMHFIEKKYCGDPTNWWVPNRACTEAMLRAAGFAIEHHPQWTEVYICRRDRAAGTPGAVYPAGRGA